MSLKQPFSNKNVALVFVIAAFTSFSYKAQCAWVGMVDHTYLATKQANQAMKAPTKVIKPWNSRLPDLDSTTQIIHEKYAVSGDTGKVFASEHSTSWQDAKG